MLLLFSQPILASLMKAIGGVHFMMALTNNYLQYWTLSKIKEQSSFLLTEFFFNILELDNSAKEVSQSCSI